MSILNIGLSGLKSTQTGLEVTSNNIANSATAGYKKSDTEFAAVYNGGQRGGVKVSNIKEDFVTGGEIVRTGNALDITIDGQGFFAISENGRTAYTQAGQFGLDTDLNIVNANGSKLQGYGVSEVEEGSEPVILSGVLTDLQIEGANIPAKATNEIAFNGNLSSASDLIPYSATDPFDPTDGSQYNFSQSTEVFDSLGNSHVMTQYFNHTAENEWQVMYFVNGEPLTAAQIGAASGAVGNQDVVVEGATVTAGVVTVNFNADGQMAPLGPFAAGDDPTLDNNSEDPFNLREITLAFTAAGGGAPMALTLDMAKSTQFGSSFAMYENDANGYTSGSFSGVDVAEDGKLYATFTNGESKLQGQVVLASFTNVNGLEPGDNTVWYETSDSGAALFGEPDSGAIGKLLSGSYMGSNVDISEQLVGLMSFQQNYQANAKTISSADEMMQILFSNT
ncbi:flagellar hook-basal body complex protein [Pseudoalteromonas shioyasakiensis]|uniref:flagellar hook protein FlgE n=1 Tax=Pseudoalteromonas shioyasakiensis TaxID=1190813 RepID=UPI00211792A8|nr:flagellar hook-basal body complex protein [Pseudoalteromonas shioyasakiensis]MCQ8877516.1 flagellar hook-basal body complex protein [Pseudoalteromonas shioyasakiensis]